MAANLLTPAEILAQAPELALLPGVVDSESEPTAPFVEIVNIAAALLGASTWGEQLSSAHWTLAAHHVAMRFDPSLAQGTITSRKIDKIQENYAAASGTGDAHLLTTKYGRIHLSLRDRLSALSAFVTRDRGWTLSGNRVI